jgi:hypothetical protein
MDMLGHDHVSTEGNIEAPGSPGKNEGGVNLIAGQTLAALIFKKVTKGGRGLTFENRPRRRGRRPNDRSREKTERGPRVVEHFIFRRFI